MIDMKTAPEQVANTERIAAAISSTPPDRQSFLCAIAEAMILGAQIAEQCAANLSTQKDAS